MTFPKYEKYRDSQEAWLGKVPSHWRTLRAKRIFRAVSEKNHPNAPLLSVTQNQGVIPRDDLEQRVVMPVGQLQTFKLVRKDDFVISLRSFQGGIEYSEYTGLVSPAYTVLRKQQEIYSGYLKWLLKSPNFISELNTSVTGIRQGKNIDFEDFALSFLPVPSAEEQERIATFLDRTTTDIDRAIAQKQRLIELLQEQKAILINQAITKGLNPNVPMRDSGIEWLGDIPKHWQLKSFKRITSRIDVGIAEAATHAYTDQGVPIIRSGNVRTNYMDTREILYIKEWFAEKNRSKYLSSGDILTVRTGANAGMTAVVPEELDHSQCFTLLVATPKANQVSQYYSYYINTPMIQSVFSVEGWGAAQVNLSVPIMKDLPIRPVAL